MRLAEAKEEFQRYLDHLKAQESMARDLQKLAADRRTGKCSEAEGRRRRQEICGISPTVYDGSSLADAIHVILKRL